MAEERDIGRFAPTPLEIAAGTPLGIDAEEPALPSISRNLTPLAAFEDAVRSALARPPCVVSFSGGRDSAAVLALAARIARLEGFPLPIATTLRIRDTPGAGEDAWQERLVLELGIEDWIRYEIDEEADYVGPVARQLLIEQGFVVQPWARLIVALQLGPARGGSMLTGIGGDQMMGGWQRDRISEFLHGRGLPARSDLPFLAAMVAPQWLRFMVLRRRVGHSPWLRPAAFREFVDAYARERAGRPRHYGRYLEWRLRLRRSTTAEAAVGRLAADGDVKVVHPFQDRRFVAALSREGGRRGFGDRTTAMRAVFPSLLPEEVVTRPGKAVFVLAHFRRHTRAFARRWDGQGFDPDLVVAEALRRAWLEPLVSPASALALQWAWLDSARRGLEQLPAGVAEPARLARPP